MNWHVNCLEMMPMLLTFREFQSELSGHHALVRLDNMTVVAYINPLITVASPSPPSMGAVQSLISENVPGSMNIGTDIPSRNRPSKGEWRLHPQAVRMIWSNFGQAEVDLFCIERELPMLYVLLQRTISPPVAFSVPLHLSSSSSAPSGHQPNQGDARF